MYKFGQIEIESKKFNSDLSRFRETLTCERIRVSEAVVLANKSDDARYTRRL